MARAVAAELAGGAATDDVRGRLAISVPENTRVLKISFRAPSPREAQRGAQAAAEAYLAQRGAVLEARRGDERQAMQAELRRIRAELADLREIFTDGDVPTPQRKVARIRSLALSRQPDGSRRSRACQR